MTENTIVFWKYCLTDDLPVDYVPGDRIDSEKDHELVHRDFKVLSEFLYRDKRYWSLAKIVADKKDVEPLNPEPLNPEPLNPEPLDPDAPDGWFRTLCHIPSEEGFFPQYEAEKKYEDYL